MSTIMDVIKNRRSVRLYRREQIKETELDSILDAGRWAPSGHNSQPWHFTVIQDESLIQTMSDISTKAMAGHPIDWVANWGKSGRNIFYYAPTVVVVSGRKEEFTTPLVDCSAAIQNMLLAAESLDIGSCWIGLARFFFEQTEEVKRLNLPEGYEPFYAVCLGYKKQPNGKGPERKTGTVSYIR